ncbi:hypothetical protein GCM10025779_09410 [Arthrobacter cryoconiti]
MVTAQLEVLENFQQGMGDPIHLGQKRFSDYGNLHNSTVIPSGNQWEPNTQREREK